MVRSSNLLVIPSDRLGGPETEVGKAVRSVLAQRREDLRLAEQVERALHVTGYPPLRAVEACVSGRLVILQGRVPSYYMKQIAQASALKVLGVHQLRNDLEVVRSR